MGGRTTFTPVAHSWASATLPTSYIKSTLALILYPGRSLYVLSLTALTYLLDVDEERDPLQGLPDQWSKLLTKSAITREDYAKDPQAVLDVLEFYTDRQKHGEELDAMMGGLSMRGGGGGPSSGTPSNLSGSTLSPYDGASAPRFNAGTGLGGAALGKLGPSSSYVADGSLGRPGAKRQDTAPPGLGSDGYVNGGTNLSLAAARAAELVSGSVCIPAFFLHTSHLTGCGFVFF